MNTGIHANLIAQACKRIEETDEPLSLDELAAEAGLSPSHFHRVFKSVTGVTPKAYASGIRAKRIQKNLRNSDGTITEALYDSGFNAASRFYESSNELLGMTPGEYRNGAPDLTIRFAVGECSLGSILVAQTDRGICAISLGDDPQSLVEDLQNQFPRATLIGADEDFERTVAVVVGFIEQPHTGLNLPLDIRGTAFQRRVWEALRKIPAGKTVSYTEIAERIGSPKSVRAVANACGKNRLAVAIPCHRVVRTDGSLSGYRWGVERKRELLKREA